MHIVCRVALIAVTLAGSNCRILDPPVCTLEERAGITVDLRDSITNAPVGGPARIIARAGAFADTVLAPDVTEYRGPYSLAWEREGVYTVTVEHEAYDVWTRGQVVVQDDECHVQTVALVARLRR